MLIYKLPKKDETPLGLSLWHRLTQSAKPPQQSSRSHEVGYRNASVLSSCRDPLLVQPGEIRDIVGHQKPPLGTSQRELLFVAST